VYVGTYFEQKIKISFQFLDREPEPKLNSFLITFTNTDCLGKIFFFKVHFDQFIEFIRFKVFYTGSETESIQIPNIYKALELRSSLLLTDQLNKWAGIQSTVYEDVRWNAYLAALPPQ
jgi:hypothetical protein